MLTPEHRLSSLQIKALLCFQWFPRYKPCASTNLSHTHDCDYNVYSFFKNHTLNLEWQWICSKH